MIKSFLILISFSIFLYSSQQVILVVSNDFNSSKAKLECFDDGKIVFNAIDVNIGKKGLGWGLGELKLNKKTEDPVKKEGDKKAPIGVFKLSSVYGYSKQNNSHMPYLHANKNLICVDESDSKYYNKIIHMPKIKPKSFEFMKRDDNQYELGVVVEHNKDAISQRGSCIFLHVQKSENAGTAGCTAMKLEDLKKIVSWLDIDKKPILIQIPKSSSKEILKLYPELNSSRILKED
ncbi:L,D-transpeptidase family protein [Sulfurimonas sp.]